MISLSGASQGSWSPVLTTPLQPVPVFGNGAVTPTPTPTPTPQPTPQPNPAPTGGNAGSTNTGTNNNPPSYNVDDQNSLIDQAAAAVEDYLKKAQSNLEGQLPGVIADAEGDFNVNKTVLDSSKQQSEAQLGESDIQAEQRKQSAIDAAIRLYNELIRGGIQRFGGASSAGQGFGELIGAEQQRNMGTIGQDFNTAKRTIEVARQKVVTDYNNSLLQLNQIKQKAIADAKRVFQDKLLEIDRMRAETAQNKAAQKLQALQTLRNNMFNVEAAVYQMKQQVDLQAQAYSGQINQFQSALDKSTASGQTAANTVPTNVTTNLAGGQTSDPTAIDQTGQTTTKKKEETSIWDMGIAGADNYFGMQS
jgi:hypothetical protein